jgi:hypothetical protein
MNTWEIGKRRVDKILSEERAKGYRAYDTGMYTDTLDIFVFAKNKDKLVRVYEVTNYAENTYMTQETANRYRDNLLQFSVERIFVCSYEYNLRYVMGGTDFFERAGIEVRIMNCQD